MIEIPRSRQHIAAETSGAPVVRIVGIGGAGSNALDRIVLDGFQRGDLLVLNTDVQSLTSSVVGQKLQLGRTVTRGLGAGGDPELGLMAAEESVDAIRAALTGAGMVFLLAGLGGGTGAGVAPLVARIAREEGCLTAVIATLPFSFEGRRRQQQALEALEAVTAEADFVLCFENDRMGDLVEPSEGIHQAFSATDQLISQSVRALCGMFQRPGPLNIGFDEMVTLFTGAHTRALFGHGESTAENRAHDALSRAVKSPFLDKGKMLEDARSLIVNIAGGTSLTLTEVQIVMEHLQRMVPDDARIFLGTAVDPAMGEKLSVTLLTSTGLETLAPVAKPRPAARPVARPKPTPVPEEPVVHPPPVEAADEEEPLEEAVEVEPAASNEHEEAAFAQEPDAAVEAQELLPAEAEPEPTRPVRTRTIRTTQTEPSSPVIIQKKVEPVQGNLPFEPVSRGRFDKSEPTIEDGEDLDVPTFLRRNIKVR